MADLQSAALATWLRRLIPTLQSVVDSALETLKRFSVCVGAPHRSWRGTCPADTVRGASEDGSHDHGVYQKGIGGQGRKAPA